MVSILRFTSVSLRGTLQRNLAGDLAPDLKMELRVEPYNGTTEPCRGIANSLSNLLLIDQYSTHFSISIFKDNSKNINVHRQKSTVEKVLINSNCHSSSRSSSGYVVVVVVVVVVVIEAP